MNNTSDNLSCMFRLIMVSEVYVMKGKRLKFRAKMLICLISAVVIISGGVQYFINTKVSDEILKISMSELTAKISGIKNNIESQLNMDKLVVKVLAANPDVISAVSEGKKDVVADCSNMLVNIVKENEKFEVIIAVDKQGVIISSNMPNTIGLNISDREYFKESVRGKLLLSEVIKNRASGNVIFGVSGPIKNGDDIIGVVYIGNKMDYLYNELIAPVKAGETGYAFVSNKQGLIIAHPDKSLIMNQEFTDSSDVVKSITKNGPGQLRYWWEPIDSYKITEILEVGGRWYLCLTVPEKELLASVRYINWLSVVGAVILIIGISIVVSFLIGAVSKVLHRLNNLILNLSEGRVGSVTDQKSELAGALKRGDEFSEIAVAVMQIQSYFLDMSKIAGSLARKDLAVTVNARGADDVLGNSMQEMIVNFNKALLQVKQSVTRVNSGSEEINSASQDLSSGATEQAAAIEEITASVMKMDEQTKVNADNAQIANNYTVNANNAAIDGQKNMQELSGAMEVMSQRASEVQKIIKTIDDIAFQTNLLALNAAVEAARAGQHGKGFAVVAEEVRNLAARSAKAAGETAVLIENVVKEINNGNQVTEVTAESLNNIAEGISKTTDIIAEITAAAAEQSEGMKQISNGLKQIEQVTQSNTASSEQTASASEQMSDLSRELNELVSEFNLGDNDNSGRKVKRLTTGTGKAKSVRSKKKRLASPDSQKADVVKPSDVIKLDDSEFGKF